MKYATIDRAILYAMAQTTTWRPPERDTVTVRTLLAGVSDARTTVELSLVAPTRRGNYWVLWTQGAEPTSVWLLSGTNWRCRTPQWGDGNELAAQPDSALAQGVQDGFIFLRFHFCGASRYTEMRRLPLAGLRVRVK